VDSNLASHPKFSGVAFAASKPSAGLKPRPALFQSTGTPVAPVCAGLCLRTALPRMRMAEHFNQQPYTDDFGTYTERIGNGAFHIEVNATKGVFDSYWPTLADVSNFTLSTRCERSADRQPLLWPGLSQRCERRQVRL